MKILILEDNAEVLQELGEWFSNNGFSGPTIPEDEEFALHIRKKCVWVQRGDVDVFVSASVSDAVMENKTTPFTVMFLDHNLLDGSSERLAGPAIINPDVFLLAL